MPGIRENVTKTIQQNAEGTPEPIKKKPTRPPSVKAAGQNMGEYSARSPIAKAYNAGLMPVDHRRLLDAIQQLLGDGTKEGYIQLEDALQITGYYRASALKMLHHMQNFGILETRRGYRETWVRILID